MCFLFRLLVKRNVGRLTYLLFIIIFRQVHSSSLDLNNLVQWQKAIENATYRKEECNPGLTHKWELDRTLSTIISFLVKKSAIDKDIPEDIKSIIMRYSSSWKNELINGACFRRFYTEKHQRNAPLKEYIDAQGVDTIYYDLIDSKSLGIFIKHMQNATIIFDRCHISSLNIELGSVCKLVVKNSHIGSLEIAYNVILLGPLYLEKSTFDRIKFYPMKHKGFTIQDKTVKLDDCKISELFFFDTLSNNALHYGDYSVIGINTSLSSKCKVHIGDNIKVLSLSSQFINASSFQDALKGYQKNCCCYGCCSCMTSYCRLNFRTFNKIICTAYKYEICNEGCCCSEEAKKDINFCLRALTAPFVLGLSCLCYPLLGGPKMCKDDIRLCCNS